MERRVKELLERHFAGSHAELYSDPLTQRVVGHFLWDGFDEVDQYDRHRTVGELLRRELGGEAQRVSTILIYTPQEYGALAAV